MPDDIYIEMDEHGGSSHDVLRRLAEMPNTITTKGRFGINSVIFILADGSQLHLIDHPFNNALTVKRST